MCKKRTCTIRLYELPTYVRAYAMKKSFLSIEIILFLENETRNKNLYVAQP